jgi:hypothetical protein
MKDKKKIKRKNQITPAGSSPQPNSEASLVIGFVCLAKLRWNSLLTNENINSKNKRMIKHSLVLEINNFGGSPVKTGNMLIRLPQDRENRRAS